MTSQTVQNGSSARTATWNYQDGQLLSMTDLDGNTTHYTYDPSGMPQTVQGPPVAAQTYVAQTPATAQPLTTYGYDTFGDRTQVQDPDRNVTSYGYDPAGRIASVTSPSYTPPGASAPITATVSYTYDGNGNLMSVAVPNSNVAGPDNVTTYTYDPFGDVTSITQPRLPGQSAPGKWQHTYDPDHELLSVTDPLLNKTTATHDYYGEQVTARRASCGLVPEPLLFLRLVRRGSTALL